MNTKLLALAAVVLLMIGTGWWAYNEGTSDCEQAHDRAALKAGRDAVKRDTASLDLGKDTTAKAEEDVRSIDKDVQEGKAEVRLVYRDIIRTVPLEGSCVHPLDVRVQKRIEQAVNAANADRRP